MENKIFATKRKRQTVRKGVMTMMKCLVMGCLVNEGSAQALPTEPALCSSLPVTLTPAPTDA